MDMYKFVTILSDSEMEELLKALQCRMTDRKHIKTATLTAEEMELVKTSKIEAIRSVSARLDCTLSTAKEIVELALEGYPYPNPRPRLRPRLGSDGEE